MINRLRTTLSPALHTQLTHLGLAIIWNVVGVVLIASGQTALGPTASLALAGVMLVFGGLLMLGARHSRLLYVTTSAFLLYSCFNAVSNAITGDASLWPSEVLRYAGIGINLIGLVGALWGLALCFKTFKTS